jgi:hypothetical protein
VGFPIRKSADQSLFAAPHGISQRTTSFIASQRQGIHRIPLRHLIALIVDAHRSAAAPPLAGQLHRLEKTIVASNAPESAAVKPRSQAGDANRRTLTGRRKSDAFPLHDVGQPATALCAAANSHSWTKAGDRAVWWSQTGSNRRPHACKARALPTELWPRSGGVKLVGLGRLELPTSRLSSARSNQLSYKPEPLQEQQTRGVARLRLVQEERETKTAAVPQMRPDWPLVFQEIREEKRASLEGSSLERR